MKILVLNSGSSSIKYCLFDIARKSMLASGSVERIGEAEGMHSYRVTDADGAHRELKTYDHFEHHRDGLASIHELLRSNSLLQEQEELFCIGHRVVHGGELFKQPVLIDQQVLEQIRQMIPLAPLHNPANLLGIEVSIKSYPRVSQVAVFDTAFHQSIPAYAYHYALPQRLYNENQVRRYGFHGTSHCYVANQAARYLGRALDSLNLITLHLGNGASAAAIQYGRSVDTSMGMTPLEGLIMGTRSGDIDPAIPFYLGREREMTSQAIESMLNKESGLKGICGANDMREVHRLAEAGDKQAGLALEMYCYRIKKYIGAYFAVLGHVDAIVFTGGIGENDAWVRERCCRDLDALGIRVDEQRNANRQQQVFEIQRQAMQVRLLVIPTDEELEIALQAMACVQGATEVG